MTSSGRGEAVGGAVGEAGADLGAPRRRAVLGAVAVFLVAFLVYANSLGGEFVWDDRSLIEHNEALASRPLDRLLLADFAALSAEGDTSGLYRPWIMLGYALQLRASGAQPFAFHLLNVLAHATVSVLVFASGWRLCAGGLGALAAGLLFAVHPVHVESVAWISGRTDVWAAVGMLGALFFYDRGRRGSEGSYVAALGFAVLAYGSKESSLVLPAVLLVLEAVWPVAGRRAGAVARGLAPFVLIAAVFVIRLLTFPADIFDVRDASPLYPDGTGAGIRLLTALRCLAQYAALFVWPFRLSAEREPAIPDGWALDIVLAAAGLVLVSALAIAASRRRPAAPLGVALAALTLAPALSVFFDLGELFAERYLYLPSAGLLLAGAALWPKDPRRGRVAFVIVLAIVAALAVRTVDRNRDWHTALGFHRVTADAEPDNPRARFKYAYELHREGRGWLERRNFPRADEWLARAQREYRASVDADSGFRDGWAGLGAVAIDRGRYDDAARVLASAASRFPGDEEIAWNLGRSLLAEGRLDEAYPLLVVSEVAGADELVDAARRFRAASRPEEAIALLGRALEIDPRHVEAIRTLGRVYASLGPGAFPAAVHCYESVLALDPEDAQTMAELAMLYLRLPDPSTRQPRAALALAEAAVDKRPTSRSLLILADVYFHLGLRDRCRDVLERALSLGLDDAAPFRARLERLDAIEREDRARGG